MLVAQQASAQGLTAALFGTVQGEQAAVLSGAVVRVSSPSLLGGAETTTTNDRGLWRFPALTPGMYAVRIEHSGFTPFAEDGIQLGAGATLARHATLVVAGVATSVVVEGAGSSSSRGDRAGYRQRRCWTCACRSGSALVARDPST
jgi:hypothetical protein